MAHANTDIRQIWKSDSSSQQIIAVNEIAKFKRKKQKSVYTSLQATCLVQVVQKIIYGLALFFAFFFFVNAVNIYIALSIVLFINLVLLGIDFQMLSKIRKLKQGDKPLAESLIQLEKFLQTDFFVYRFYASFSNPILIISGILYYSYIKYGNFRIFTEIDSLIVFGSIIIISFFIAYAGMVFSSVKILNEIQSYNAILEDSENYKQIIRKDKKRRLRMAIFMIFLLVIAILMFLLIVAE